MLEENGTPRCVQQPERTTEPSVHRRVTVQVLNWPGLKANEARNLRKHRDTNWRTATTSLRTFANHYYTLSFYPISNLIFEIRPGTRVYNRYLRPISKVCCSKKKRQYIYLWIIPNVLSFIIQTAIIFLLASIQNKNDQYVISTHHIWTAVGGGWVWCVSCVGNTCKCNNRGIVIIPLT